jgi:hypothetical protein
MLWIRHYLSGSESASFHHKAKTVIRTLFYTVLWLLHDFLSLKNDGKVPTKNKSKKLKKNKLIFLKSWKPLKKSRIRIRNSCGTDPRIRIRAKIPRIHNTDLKNVILIRYFPDCNTTSLKLTVKKLPVSKVIFLTSI